MSASQQRGRKPQKKATEKVVVEEKKSITLDEVFNEPVEVKRPEPEPKEVKAEATPKEPVVVVNIDKLLRWAARLKTGGGFGAWGNGANFANHMIRDSFTVNGEQPSLEEASKLIAEHTSVAPKDPWA